MKVIDEKGRIFGRINIIDFSVILFLLLLTPMFYYGHKFFKKPVVMERLTYRCEVTIKFSSVIPQVVEALREGDVEKHGSAVIGTLKKIVSVNDSALSFFNPNENRMVVVRDPLRKDAVAIFDVEIFELLGNLYYKSDSYEIKLGGPMGFKTDSYEINGQIINIKK